MVFPALISFPEWLKLEIWRDGKTYEQEYSVGIPVAPLAETGTTAKRGTKVTFKPDGEIFDVTEFSLIVCLSGCGKSIFE